MWNHYRGRHWHTALENGLAPIGAGLILAGVFAIFRVAGAGILSWVVAGVAAAILAWHPKLNPLILLVGGAVAFAAWHGMVPSG
jgi:chromate transporter